MTATVTVTATVTGAAGRTQEDAARIVNNCAAFCEEAVRPDIRITIYSYTYININLYRTEIIKGLRAQGQRWAS